MKPKLLLCMTLFLPLGLLRWEEMVSYDGRFRVLTPGSMTEKVDTLATGIGQIEYHTFFYQPPDEAADGNWLYAVSYCDYPMATVHSDSIDLLDEFFASTIDEAVAVLDGALSYSSELELQGYPGRFWRIDYSEGGQIVKNKAVLVRNRLYTLQVFSLQGREINEEAGKFLDSFQLLE